MRERTIKVTEAEHEKITRAQKELRKQGYVVLQQAFPGLDIQPDEYHGWPTLGAVVAIGSEILVRFLEARRGPGQSPPP